MPADGAIVISGERQGDRVECRVRDTGSGMAPETAANIFEPFFSTKGAANSGLGLAVIHGIILRHGGTITVDSTLGEGTAFTVALPAFLPEPTPAAGVAGLATVGGPARPDPVAAESRSPTALVARPGRGR